MKSALDQSVERFLCWKLPADFCPDNGISFKPYSDYEHPDFGRTKFEPIGTNILTADQAKAMLEHVCEPMLTALQERDAEIERLKGPVPEDTISNQRTIQDNPRSAIGIMQRQNKKIEAQRKVLEQALEALKLCSETISIEQIYERGKAITAIQEQLK